MKRRIMSVVLSVAMALSLAVPAMAVETAEKTTGIVVVEDVPGGMVMAYTSGETGRTRRMLPVGEEVELPLDESVQVNSSATLNYYVDGQQVRTHRTQIGLATAPNAEPYQMDISRFKVEEGTTYVKATFETELVGSSSSVSGLNSQIEITFDPILKASEGAGSVKVTSVEYGSEGENGRWTWTEWPLSSVSLQLGERVWRRNSDEYRTDFKFDDATKTLSWSDGLDLGTYDLDFTVTHDGITYDGEYDEDGYVYINSELSVGYEVNLCYVPYEYESVRADGSKYSTYSMYSGASLYFDNLNQTVATLDNVFDSQFGIYNYTRTGWQVMKNGSYVDVASTDKLSSLINGNSTYVTLRAKFVNDKTGKPYSYTIRRIDQVDDVLDTEKELTEAIGKLPADVDETNAKTFDAGVAEIVDGMKKLKDEKAQMAIANALGAKLKDVLNLKLVPGDVTADDSIFVALGLTSSKDKDKTVELVVTNVATSSNASRVGEFTVEVKINGETHSGTLSVPVEVTIELPADMVASMANAGKQYVVVIGGKEIPVEYDETTNTIKFTTSVLGHFIIREKTKETTGSSGTVTGLTGGRGKSTKTDLNASGTWVHDDKGWWFKYTSGGYPASKWEMIKNKWYYFNADGYMATGWQLIGNSWYHLDEVNGDRTTGWYLDAADGKWYYFNSSGVMQTGWKLIKEKYYYLSPESAAPTYTYDAAAQKWVYTNTKARPYGSMYANEVTPDGYTVDANGVWVQ